MANWPTFDPNHPSRYAVANQKNRCVNDQFEPGSTFKTITAAAALSTGAADLGSVYYAGRGWKKFLRFVIHDVSPHAWLDFPHAFALSSNVCFAEIAASVGRVGLYTAARDFGFGCLTGITLPGEVRGTLREPSEWSRRSVYSIGIGQEVAVTALQLAGAFSAVANGGYLMNPHVVRAVVDDDGRVVEEARWEVVRQATSPVVAASVRELLTMAADYGTGQKAAITEFAVAGKTGTAQKVVVGTPGFAPGKYVSSFAGFAPANDPRLVCLVVIDEPEGRGLGGDVAAPVFGRIMERIVRGPGHEYVLIDDGRARTARGQEDARPTGPSVAAASTGAGTRYEPAVGPASADALFARMASGAEGQEMDAVRTGGAGGLRAREAEGLDASTALVESTVLPGEAVSVPDLRGMSIRRARRTAAELGLNLSFEGSGNVREQSPKGGANARYGDKVVVRCYPG